MKLRTTLLTVLLGACLGFGCESETCPPAYPVMRDGFCYTADGDASVPLGDAGGGGIDGSSADSGGVTDDSGMLDAAAPICTGTHPLVDGTRRYCEPGSCYCGDPDSCYPQPIAEACCSVSAVCEGTDGGTADAGTSDGGGVICTGTHPLVEGTRRYCETGDCFCSDPDNCYPDPIASTCCTVAVVCE